MRNAESILNKILRETPRQFNPQFDEANSETEASAAIPVGADVVLIVDVSYREGTVEIEIKEQSPGGTYTLLEQKAPSAEVGLLIGLCSATGSFLQHQI